MASHAVELLVERPVEVPQALHHFRVNVGVGPPFGLAQAMGLAVALRPLKAREALGRVEVEVLLRDYASQPQEILYACHLPGWVVD